VIVAPSSSVEERISQTNKEDVDLTIALYNIHMLVRYV